MKGAISALASLQGHLLIASGPKIILHKWTGTELNGVAFFDAPPLYVVSLNIVSASEIISLVMTNKIDARPLKYEIIWSVVLLASFLSACFVKKKIIWIKNDILF